MANLDQLAESVLAGNLKRACELTTEALDEGVEVDRILNDGLIAGMTVVGIKFKNNELFVPEVLIAARAMNGAMKILEPKLADAGIEPIGTVVLGTVKGDLHDIGKNLVGMMLKGAGFNVIDIGVDCDPDQFLKSAEEHSAQIVAVSALLTTTMVNMKDVVAAVRNGSTSQHIKIMVGGAPVTQSYCDEIGADGYAPDAASATDIACGLIEAA